MDINFYEKDCEKVLVEIPTGSIDLILQDPPYGVTQNDWDTTLNLSNMWTHWERVIKDDGAIIIFAQQPFSSELILSNPKLFRYDLVWYKPLGTGHLNAKRMPMRNHEYILVFYKKLPVYNPQMGIGKRKKGKRKNNRNGTNYGKFSINDLVEKFDDKGTRYPQSVIEFTNGDRTKENDHPTQKPLSLIRYLVRTYSNLGDTIFDGYVGSGTTAIACIKEKRNFIGSEINSDYFKKAMNRIELEQSKLVLF